MILSILGLIFFVLPFTSFPPPIGGFLQNMIFIKVALIMLAISILYSIVLIVTKQKGIMKYTPFLMVGSVVVFMYYFSRSMGAL